MGDLYLDRVWGKKRENTNEKREIKNRHSVGTIVSVSAETTVRTAGFALFFTRVDARAIITAVVGRRRGYIFLRGRTLFITYTRIHL